MSTQPGLSIARHNFKIKVLALDQDCICWSLGGCDGDVQAHHVIYQKHLIRAGLDHLLWDETNGAAVCERHHRRHHHAHEAIPQELLPQRCLDFVAEHDLGYLLDRFYKIPS